MAAAESTNKGAMVTLISSDNARFEVDEAAASLSRTVRRMMTETGGGGRDGSITLPNVDAVTLAKVLEYCNKHAFVATCSSGDAAAAAASERDELERFDEEFVNVDSVKLLVLINAAPYLGIEGLVDITCKKAANMIVNMTPEQIRLMFGIRNEFTPEEEEFKCDV